MVYPVEVSMVETMLLLVQREPGSSDRNCEGLSLFVWLEPKGTDFLWVLFHTIRDLKHGTGIIHDSFNHFKCLLAEKGFNRGEIMLARETIEPSLAGDLRCDYKIHINHPLIR